ncbi:MAG TPA: hypothetical protein PLK35_03605 [Candidatus Moranbacteria bacterium]|nr:hypothetical protein [Candidatus Moranbacteria bacterium]
MEVNINLLPDYRKEEIEKAKRLKLTWRFGLFIIIFFLIFFSFLFGIRKILEINFNSIISNQKAGSDSDKYEEIKKYDEEFSRTNQEVSQVLAIKKDQIYWSNLFVILSKASLPGVEFTDIKTKNYKVFLIGKADSRDNLTALKENLEKSSCFENLAFPLSNLVSKENVDFQMDFDVKEECLKKQ